MPRSKCTSIFCRITKKVLQKTGDSIQYSHCPCVSTKVLTKSGPVEGFKTIGQNGKVLVTFYGIPYAESPVGQLRFKSPVPVKPWTEIFKATDTPHPCPQVLKVSKRPSKYPMILKEPSEDCLKLNIWVPRNENNASKKTVMVFIHGGGFLEGSSINGYVDGKHLAEREDVIVVTINYRLGPLGFLYLGDEAKDEVPGNAGLFDQQLALKWIKDNIESFGGDSESITIFGCSAGSASVGLHLLSPGSKGLFRRAIMMSGTPGNPRVVRDKRVLLEALNRLLDNLHYQGDYDNTKEILTFLRKVDCAALPMAGQYGITGILDIGHFGPTVDGIFLPKSPMEYLKPHKFENNVDLMIGNVSDEGICFFKAYFPEIYKKMDTEGITEAEHYKVIEKINNRGLTTEQIRQLSKHYRLGSCRGVFKMVRDPMVVREATLALVSDILYNMDAEYFSERYSYAGNRVFRYEIDQKLPIFKFPEYTGAIHVSDQLLVLGMRDQDLPKDIVEFGHQLSKRWANFARHGNPNLEGIKEEWSRYGTFWGNFYATMNARGLSQGRAYKRETYAHWHANILQPNVEQPNDSDYIEIRLDTEATVESVAVRQ